MIIQLQNWRGISGDFRLGKITRICGANGSGKSSVIMALETYHAGRHPYFPQNSWTSLVRSAADWSVQSGTRKLCAGIKALLPTQIGQGILDRYKFESASGPEKTRMLAAGKVESAEESLREARTNLVRLRDEHSRAIGRLRLLMADASTIVQEVTAEQEAEVQRQIDELERQALALREADSGARQQQAVEADPSLKADMDQALAEHQSALGDGYWQLAKDVPPTLESCPICGTTPFARIAYEARMDDLEQIEAYIADLRGEADKAAAAHMAADKEAQAKARDVARRAEALLSSAAALREGIKQEKLLVEVVRRARERQPEVEAEVDSLEQDYARAMEATKAAERGLEAAASEAWLGLATRAAFFAEAITGRKMAFAERSGRLVAMIGGQPLPEVALSGGERLAVEIAMQERFHPGLAAIDEVGRLSPDAIARMVAAVASSFDQVVYAQATDGPLELHAQDEP